MIVVAVYSVLQTISPSSSSLCFRQFEQTAPFGTTPGPDCGQGACHAIAFGGFHPWTARRLDEPGGVVRGGICHGGGFLLLLSDPFLFFPRRIRQGLFQGRLQIPIVRLQITVPPTNQPTNRGKRKKESKASVRVFRRVKSASHTHPRAADKGGSSTLHTTTTMTTDTHTVVLVRHVKRKTYHWTSMRDRCGQRARTAAV
jgi:hypothetical protein